MRGHGESEEGKDERRRGEDGRGVYRRMRVVRRRKERDNGWSERRQKIGSLEGGMGRWRERRQGEARRGEAPVSDM